MKLKNNKDNKILNFKFQIIKIKNNQNLKKLKKKHLNLIIIKHLNLFLQKLIH